jgi:hypothetical protein
MLLVPDSPGARNQQLTFSFAAPCPHDGGAVLHWHRWAHNGGTHLVEFCVHCGKWLCWVPQPPRDAR